MISIYNTILLYFDIHLLYIIKKEVGAMNIKPLVIKKRGEDGNKLISVRIKEDTLVELDRIAAESNYSRNELINKILAHGVKNIIIEDN